MNDIVCSSNNGWLNMEATPLLRGLKPIRNFLCGRVQNNPHPLHPAVVHFAVALLPLSFMLDILAYVPFVHWITGITTTTIHSVAFYLLLIGVLSSTIAALTGFAEFTLIPLSSPAFKPALLHASLNSGALVVGLMNWISRRSLRYHSPSKTLMLLNIITLFGLFYSAYVGGSLVYKHAIGVQRMGDGLKMKKKEELKEFGGKASQ